MASISGIEIYPLVSFGIFFLFFLAVAFLVIKADRTHIQTMSNMPLEDEE